MIKHVALVTESADYLGTSPGDPARKTIGTIIVQPPIYPGERFKDAALGLGSEGVDIAHVVTRGDRTSFLAESTRPGTPEDRRRDIELIAVRVGHIANRPDNLLPMLMLSPFSKNT